MVAFQELADLLARSTGAEAALDQALAGGFAVPVEDFTASVDAARRLAVAALPGWKFHVGYDAGGMFPYAALTLDDLHVEASAPTVPLAILRAAVAAKLRQEAASAP